MALEIAGTAVPESVQVDKGKTLQLNGAGIRSKFFFKIYIVPSCIWRTRQPQLPRSLLTRGINEW